MASRLARAASTAALLITAGLLVAPAPTHGEAAPGILDKTALLGSIEDPDWFRANIPFLEVPDRQIQDVYYYRWAAYKEHLVYTGPEYGWLSNEFLSPAAYGAPYGGISAAAGHQITEGRWLRDQRYVKSTIGYWLNGPGQFPKPRTEFLNPDAGDWAHQYSFWAADAVWQQYLAAGDRAFTASHRQNLQRQYDGWADHFNPSLGLYWQVPVWDASEYTASSHETSDPYHGGHGYRPTLNSYQYGDARAIANIAALTGDTATANAYNARAEALRTNTQNRLWDPQRQFYYGLHRDSLARTGSREIMGYLPWMFNLPAGNANAAAWSQLKDPQGFKAAYGPTTAERRSPWFMRDATAGCCRWNGPSWPFATSQTLTAAANLLDNYPAQPYFSSQDYVELLRGYAATQYRNGVPYVAEAHHPDENRWLYDSYNHSEDYNHSTYVDNVISGLIGLRGQPDNTLRVQPLAPATWDYFALENTPYHGHDVSVFWDRTGGRYGLGAGLRVYVDGTLRASQAGLSAVTVDVGPAVTQAAPGVVNIAANGQRLDYRTRPFASYTSPHDDVYRAVDGQVWRTPIPNNTRWTSWNSPNASDHLGLDFRRPVTIREVRLHFYDDGGGVRVPLNFDLQYWTGATWVTVPGQVRTGGGITFPALTTTQLRVTAPNRGGGVGWGVQEFEVWSAPVFTLFNGAGKVLAVQNASTADSANVQQYADTGTPDHRWTLVEAGGGYYKVVNLNSGLLLAVQNASTAAGAQVQQYHDAGTPDQQWSIVDTGSGRMKLRNRNSGLFLGVQGNSTANSANAVQATDGALWTLRHSAR